MRIPRTACINDLSGFGRCSLTTALSVISAAGVQVCPVPTAVLSKHTGFPSFYFADLTSSMPPYLEDWKDLCFDGIYSGFLGSPEQIEIVEDFIISQKKKNPEVKVIIDPVMGDKGKLYTTYTDDMYLRMQKLISCADLITPNITEACFLTDTEYKGEEISDNDAIILAKRLAKMGCGQIVLTGIVRDSKMINVTFDETEFSFKDIRRAPEIFSGTGDIFSSVVCACILRNHTLPEAVSIAGNFISDAIEYTIKEQTPLSEGVIFEPFLYKLGKLLCDRVDNKNTK